MIQRCIQIYRPQPWCLHAVQLQGTSAFPYRQRSQDVASAEQPCQTSKMSATPDTTTSSSAATVRSSGRGSGGANRGTRGSRGGRTRSNATATKGTSRNLFKGDTKDMNGNVFQCYKEQVDRRQYAKTIKALDAYTRKKLTYSANLAPLFAAKMGVPIVDLPSDLAPGTGDTMKIIFAEEVKEYVKRTWDLASNIATVFAAVWGQCSENVMQIRQPRTTVSGFYDR